MNHGMLTLDGCSTEPGNVASGGQGERPHAACIEPNRRGRSARGRCRRCGGSREIQPISACRSPGRSARPPLPAPPTRQGARLLRLAGRLLCATAGNMAHRLWTCWWLAWHQQLTGL
jgi:hypothetical protein